MKPSISLFFVFFIGLFLAAGFLAACDEAPEAPPAAKPQVEVVFVLDSTGSMGGLIEGAKQKIWAIANEIILQKPEPDVRMGLLTYRDKGDEYITKMMDLTTDVDAIYGFLMPIVATGGGDEPESVNQALDEAVNKMSWSPKEKNVYRVIFLVGDAPPHMDYQDDVKYTETCKKALENNILINTIQCGNIASCTPFWQEIAQISEGNYSRIMQSGNVVVVESPFDREISELTTELGSTVITYGSASKKAEVMDKLKVAESAPMAARADRAAFNLKRGSGAILGSGDLVADVKENAELLNDSESLPEPMQAMSLGERQLFVEEQSARRTEINTKLSELTVQRNEWLATEGKKLRLDASGTVGDEGRLAGRRALSEAKPAMVSGKPVAAGLMPLSSPARPASPPMSGEELVEAEAADMSAPAEAPEAAASFDESVSETIQSQFRKAMEK